MKLFIYLASRKIAAANSVMQIVDQSDSVLSGIVPSGTYSTSCLVKLSPGTKVVGLGAMCDEVSHMA